MNEPKYGIDAPIVPISYFSCFVILALLGIILISLGHDWAFWLLGYAFFCLICLFFYMHSTLKGKFTIWNNILADLEIKQQAHFLDLGCGRGAIFYLIIKKLGTTVQGTGIDLWKKIDQSGNGIDIARKNAELEGISKQIDLITGDIRSLPFKDQYFDFVTSNLVIHNIHQKADREKALQEAHRVLKEGGKLIITDISKVKEYKCVLENLGMVNITLKNAGWQGWWTGPWVPTYILIATK
ncbi:class I SAM-dependent methyltransferase [Bacillus ginsengihumi]|uniref:Class I SAM-dependent methyltransferase n=1 Tax=Heyndrickxia ginsengihumi TaxID=363870 RepID=A0A6M0P682_9BACI|nr:class I SAM-dependent methyltransferase [Heyndrickxia ginsengihumi]NEY20224.1 class I SAM-dependent methyltransferase [Heyndrickxia ginsengihumi]